MIQKNKKYQRSYPRLRSAFRSADKGFTLVEILLVIFFMVVLTVLGLISYRSFENKMHLITNTNEVIAALHLSSERTISSKGGTVYGVHFEEDFFTLFSGVAYNPLSGDNEVHFFPASVEFYDELGATPDVIFDRITGETSSTDNIILRLVNDTSETRTIKVSALGRVGLGGATVPTGARVEDSRHIHFDLGWSLQGSTNLTLDFQDPPNPDVQEVIVMADYFGGGETEFNWTGVVDVNGENQTLRIHTHSLDAFDTSLCIHRDGRYNDKTLNISVDGKNIVSYTPAGVATVGIFGGTMTVQ